MLDAQPSRGVERECDRRLPMLSRVPRARKAEDVALGLVYVCGRAGVTVGRVH